MKSLLNSQAMTFRAILTTFFILAASTVIAQAGLDRIRVEKDLNKTLADASESMLVVQSFDIVNTRKLIDDRYQVDISMTVRANEQEMRNAISRAKSNRLSTNWREEVARIERLAQSAYRKNGTTESIKAIYKLNNIGAWELTEISDNTSEYTRLRNENGGNNAPKESQIVSEFTQLVKLISNGSATIETFTIKGAQKLRNNAVKLSIDITMKGNNSNADNIAFARGVNGVTNSVEVIYQRDPRGNWRRLDVE